MPKSLYERKLELFRKLGELSSEMAGFTPERLVDEEGAAELFQGLVQQREAIMKQADEITAQINQVQVAVGEYLSPELESLQRDLRAEGARIQAHNQSIEAVVKTALTDLREKTKKIQEVRQSHRAYDSRVLASEGSFIDKRR